MAGTIESIPLDVTEQLSKYNVVFNNYKMNGAIVDYERLAVDISKQRATAVESQVTPLATTMRTRNTALEELGNALAVASGAQANFNDDSEGSDTTSLSQECVNICKKYLKNSPAATTISKSNLANLVQMLKTKIDALNNDAQTDMTSLQSLVDKRDQGYSTATELMTKISDGRKTTIRNV